MPTRSLTGMRSAKGGTAQPQNQAVLYTRVSSKDQEKEGFSIPAQQRLLHEYALKKGLTILQEFSDVETASDGWKPYVERRAP